MLHHPISTSDFLLIHALNRVHELENYFEGRESNKDHWVRSDANCVTSDLPLEQLW